MLDDRTRTSSADALFQKIATHPELMGAKAGFLRFLRDPESLAVAGSATTDRAAMKRLTARAATARAFLASGAS